MSEYWSWFKARMFGGPVGEWVVTGDLAHRKLPDGSVEFRVATDTEQRDYVRDEAW